MTPDETLLKTPLHALHVELGAKMVPFAGYDMPVQYKLGVLGEHNHTREKAGLFDVSHMGQAMLEGPDHVAVSKALETLVAADIEGIEPGSMRYTQLLNAEGGIIDDLMVTRPADPALAGRLMLVVNAARKAVDYAYLRDKLPAGIKLTTFDTQALIALQGPAAETVMSNWCAEAAKLTFMTACPATFDGIDCTISRSGYTGEDGYEISVRDADVEKMARTLLSHADVAAIGLGARDSLRLEAGLCLYGHDIDETTSPVEAALTWSVGKRRREEANFPGAGRILKEIGEGVSRKRVGIRPEGRGPAREGTQIVDAKGEQIGVVTSGGFGPTADAPVAMGYVDTAHAKLGTSITLMVRGKPRTAEISAMPFIEKRYRK
ncbi:MAG: glycine cleavage system aminomethyltransferase GcvT [Alphaproteobacteria bacterium]|nr:glycine cleavage system aminomethyltransferase GcvT [Alphaproteobacteria bacterium]MBO6627936.1 glycine cleavage system aminomethyltransferase GcvT [Alphaproteobacteria bacterium]MDF1625506.1 glycine cleavage system aminomethyltransferase GcvT [Parvibaculaceae bacterium]